MSVIDRKLGKAFFNENLIGQGQNVYENLVRNLEDLFGEGVKTSKPELANFVGDGGKGKNSKGGGKSKGKGKKGGKKGNKNGNKGGSSNGTNNGGTGDAGNNNYQRVYLADGSSAFVHTSQLMQG